MKHKLWRGIVVGLLGTSAMTAVQETLGSSASNDGQAPSWEDASAPAQVARKGLRLLGHDPPPSSIPFLTNAMHWGYGTTWGVLYTLTRGTKQHSIVREGIAFGAFVWAASYAQLVPMGIYQPPWKYDAKTLAYDFSYHAAFGVAATAAAAAT